MSPGSTVQWLLVSPGLTPIVTRKWPPLDCNELINQQQHNDAHRHSTIEQDSSKQHGFCLTVVLNIGFPVVEICTAVFCDGVYIFQRRAWTWLSRVERDRAHNPHLPMPSLPPIIHLPGASKAGNQILDEKKATKIYEMICTRVLLF